MCDICHNVAEKGREKRSHAQTSVIPGINYVSLSEEIYVGSLHT